MNWDANEHNKSREIALGYDKAWSVGPPVHAFNYPEKRVIRIGFSELPEVGTTASAPFSTSRVAVALLATGYRVHGLDISAGMLGVASKPLQKCGERFSHPVGNVKALPSYNSICDAALCTRVLMRFTLREQIKFVTMVSELSSFVAFINDSLGSGYQRSRRKLKRLLGDHHNLTRNPINDQDIVTRLREAESRKVLRCQLPPGISKAGYLAAEGINPASEDAGANARTAQTAAP